jgi:glycosyltransferase involved in cell wall biosynthesis
MVPNASIVSMTTVFVLLVTTCVLTHVYNNRYIPLYNHVIRGSQGPKYGIVLSCFNRPEYLRRTLDSLKNTDKQTLSQLMLCIIDDRSTDPQTKKMIEEFDMDEVKIIKKIVNRKNYGITGSLTRGFDLLYRSGCDYMTNIDSDVVLKPHWLSKLHAVYEESNVEENGGGGVLVSGFTCSPDNPNHKIIKSTERYHVKVSVGGVNTFFRQDMYPRIRTALRATRSHWDWNVCGEMRIHRIPIISTRPSVIQHIGVSGMNSGIMGYDVAIDF